MKLLNSVSYFNGRIISGPMDEGVTLEAWIKTMLKAAPEYTASQSGRRTVNTQRVFIDDLNMCYDEIIKAIRDLGYVDVAEDERNRRTKKGAFSYIISSTGCGIFCYKIEVACKNKNHIQFCNLNSFFTRTSVSKLDMYDEILRKLNSKTKLGITPASTARNAWNNKLVETGLRVDFFDDERKIELPVRDKDGSYMTLDDYCRNAHGGGWCSCTAPEARDMGAGVRYDVHSLYPSILKAGVPSRRFFYTTSIRELKDGADSCDSTYLVHFKCKFKIKPGCIPFADIHTPFGTIHNAASSMHTSKRGGDYSRELWMFAPEFKAFRKYYDIKDFEFIDAVCFELTDAGKWYVDEHYTAKEAAKQNKDSSTAQVHKILMNSVIGGFGRRKSGNVIVYNKFMQPCEIESANDAKSHMSIASYIISCGRARLADIANQNADRFMYCDTDSIHLRGSEPGVGIELGKDCGQFGIEDTFTHSVYYGQKKYIEWGGNEPKVTFAGLPYQYAECIADSLDFGTCVTNASLMYGEEQVQLFNQSIENLLKCEHLSDIAFPYKYTGAIDWLVYCPSKEDMKPSWKKDQERIRSLRYNII